MKVRFLCFPYKEKLPSLISQNSIKPSFVLIIAFLSPNTARFIVKLAETILLVYVLPPTDMITFVLENLASLYL